MDIITLIALVVIGIIVVTMPIYLAAKAVSKKASFGRAVIAALIGPVIFYVVLIVVGTLTAIVFAFLLPIAFIIALVFLIYFYSVIFDTSFLGGLLIAIISVIITAILLIILSALSLFALTLPGGRKLGFLSIFTLMQGHPLYAGMFQGLLPLFY